MFWSNVGTNAVLDINLDSNGAGSVQHLLNPLGLNASSFVSAAYQAPTQVDPQHLRWLGSQADGFANYRVTRAKLVFVSNVGSTVSGKVILSSSNDASDCLATPTSSLVVKGRQFDLAFGSSKEISIPLDIDSSWKKVGFFLTSPANVRPFNGLPSQMIILNSLNDLCFGSFTVAVVGGPASTNVGNLFIDYDVEFKNPVSPQTNF